MILWTLSISEEKKTKANILKRTKGERNMKITKMISVILFSLVSLLIWSGQSFSAEEYSGFLEKYPKFEPDKDRKGSLNYRAPGIEIKKYSKIFIYPIEIFVAPDAKYKGFKPDELKKITDMFVETLTHAIEPQYPVVDNPGQGVMGIRMAITNVYPKKAKLKARHLIPVAAVIRIGKTATGNNIALADATIEVEMVDMQTYERLGAVVDRYSADPDVKKGDETSWKEINKVLDFYGKRLRAFMDKEHSR